MTTAAQLGLSKSQYDNALGIIAAVKARRWEMRAAVISVEAALTESGMRMIASANVPASQKYAYEKLSWTDDGLGHDHASMGMFQQQTGYKWCPNGYGWNMNQTTMNSANGWGTPAELMNAEKSTAKFLNALARVDWRHMTRWAAAQAVQRSAFSDGSNYRKQDARALRIVQALWDVSASKPAPVKKPTPKPSPKPPVKKPVPPKKPVSKVRIIGTYEVRRGDTLTIICRRYPQKWITPASVAKINGLSSPNHIVIGQKLRIGGTP